MYELVNKATGEAEVVESMTFNEGSVDVTAGERTVNFLNPGGSGNLTNDEYELRPVATEEEVVSTEAQE